MTTPRVPARTSPMTVPPGLHRSKCRWPRIPRADGHADAAIEHADISASKRCPRVAASRKPRCVARIFFPAPLPILRAGRGNIVEKPASGDVRQPVHRNLAHQTQQRLDVDSRRHHEPVMMLVPANRRLCPPRRPAISCESGKAVRIARRRESQHHICGRVLDPSMMASFSTILTQKPADRNQRAIHAGHLAVSRPRVHSGPPPAFDDAGDDPIGGVDVELPLAK